MRRVCASCRIQSDLYLEVAISDLLFHHRHQHVFLHLYLYLCLCLHLHLNLSQKRVNIQSYIFVRDYALPSKTFSAVGSYFIWSMGSSLSQM